MLKQFYLTVLILATGLMNLEAQNEIPGDSLSKNNMQPPSAPDTLKKTQQANTAPPKSEVRKDTRPVLKRFHLSLSTAFWANSNSIYFEISPMLSYYFPKTWSVGAGPTYIYNKDLDIDKSYNGWGGKVYGRADITKWLYGWTEYQGINNQQLKIESLFPYKTSKDYEYVDSWFLSVGINLRLGRRHLNMQALYDVFYDKDDAYMPSAWTYRIGFGF